MGTKKGQQRKTARRAYEGKGPRRSKTKPLFSWAAAGGFPKFVYAKRYINSRGRWKPVTELNIRRKK